MNAFLRLQAFVEVFVTGHHHVDAIFQKQRLELIAQGGVGPVAPPDE